MTNKNLTKTLLLGLCVLLASQALKANAVFTWGSTDGEPGTLGHSNDFLVQANVVRAGSATVGDLGGTLTLQTGDILNLDGTVTVSGDVILDASNADNVKINVGDFTNSLASTPGSFTNKRGYVWVRPQLQNLNFPDTEWGHLAIVTGQDKIVDVCCSKYSLAFTGSFTTIDEVQINRKLFLSFWGQGKVNFRLKDGCCVVFKNHINDGSESGLVNPAGIDGTGHDEQGNPILGCGCRPTDINELDQHTSGVRVFVIMDQNKTQAIDNGECKLVFSRFQFEPFTKLQNPKEGMPADVWVGRNSFITYASEVADGVDDGTTGYGSIAFDPSASGKSRLVLRVLGGAGDDHNDGAFVVAGHRIPRFADAGFTAPRFAELNHHAGVQALFKVSDELAYSFNSSYFDTSDSRRGLLVVNTNKTVPFFAANPYSTDRSNPNKSGREGNSWWRNAAPRLHLGSGKFGADLIRQGFVIGTNGHLRLYHNTFLDYVAASKPRPYFNAGSNEFEPTGDELSNVVLLTPSINVEDFVHQPSKTVIGSQRLPEITKLHNPSALIIDGLTDGLANDGVTQFVDPLSQVNGAAMQYMAFSNGRHAKITLEGDSGIYLHSAAGRGADLGEPRGVKNNMLEESNFTPDLFAYDCGGDCVFSFTIGKGPYRLATDSHCPSYWVPALTPNQENIDVDQCTHQPGEGHHVLDVEGRLTVCSVDDTAPLPTTVLGRHQGTGALRAGKINVPAIQIDHAANEQAIDPFTNEKLAVTQPLDKSGAIAYPRYQSSTLFFNAPIDYPASQFGSPSVAFYNVSLVWNDVAKQFAVPDPRKAEPGITGGSRAMFDDACQVFPELPVIRLFNSNIDLHESLIASGVRFDISEVDAGPDGEKLFGTDAQNRSVITSFNHGDVLDTRAGRGRIFMLGTHQNLPFLGTYQSQKDTGAFATFYNQPFPLQNAFINIYRRTQTPLDQTPSDLIQLSLRTADQFPVSLTDQQKEKQRAKHLIFIANQSNIALGWVGEFGDRFIHPWWNTMSASTEPNQFDIGNAVSYGTLSIDDNFYYFGGIDGYGPVQYDMFNNLTPIGNQVVRPVVGPGQGRVVYVNHGGSLRTADQVDVVFDTVIARRLSQTDELRGHIDIPNDQLRFTRNNGIQPYALDLTGGNLHLDVYNQNRQGLLIDTTSGEEVVIPWLYRTDSPNFLPIKRPDIKQETLGQDSSYRAVYTDSHSDVQALSMFRSTPNVGNPVVMPTNLLFVTTGDRIRQLRVQGATSADPFHLLISGDTNGFARIREFTTQSIDRTCDLVRPVYGDGAYAALFFNNGGRAGLGNRDWNSHSQDAWSVLGWDYVTVFADGNGIIDVNSDLLCADKLPLVATQNFGVGATHRIEFVSEDHRVVRIPEGSELDLSSFGRGDGPLQQQIAFGGKIKLVFEPGASLRFPDGGVVDGQDGNGSGPVLYMNDDAQLIFEGNRDRDQARFTDVSGVNAQRCKIMGKGQIWLNKNARMEVMGSGCVGIQADAQTPNTDITISLQRQGGLFVGDQTLAGGCLQVGNPESIEGASINFTLRLDGPRARFHTDRQGFVGFGVGALNKSGAPNGDALLSANPVVVNGVVSTDGVTGKPLFTPDEASAWQLHTLFDVNNIEIRTIRGIVDHSNIFDGSDRQASLWAVGPVNGTYTMRLGNPADALVFGGGNVVFLREVSALQPYTVNVWSFADPLEGGEVDTGKYSILSSTIITRQRTGVENQDAATSITFPTSIEGVVLGIDASGVPTPVGQEFVGNQDDFYKFMTFPNYPTMSSTPNGVSPYVCLGATELGLRSCYVNNNLLNQANQFVNIVRTQDPTAYTIAGIRGDARDGLVIGALGGSGADTNGGPERVTIVRV